MKKGNKIDLAARCQYPGCVLERIPGKPFCAGHRAVAFVENHCCHTKSKWAGLPFNLIPWQRKILMAAYGTVDDQGRRQYRFVYLEIPKKNGKSELGSAVALLGLVADDEAAPEVYCAAGDKEQASLVYVPAAAMVRHDRALSRRLTIVDSRKRIYDRKSGGFMQVLSAEVYTKHGLSPSTIVFDEIHAQPTRELYDVLTEGTDIARPYKQTVWILTTAGVEDKTSIGWEVHEYARGVLEGRIIDPQWLVMIFGADRQKDDWESKKVWRKVNPSLGHVFEMENLVKHYRSVKNNPARLNSFLRFRLNMWVGQTERIIPMDKWAAGAVPFDEDRMLERLCFVGVDLSGKFDLTAVAYVFPPNGDEVTTIEVEDEKGTRITRIVGPWRAIVRFFCPEETIAERSKNDKVPYDAWVRAGWITATPGSSVSYQWVEHEILNGGKKFAVQAVAYDPWNAYQMAQELDEEHGVPVVEMRQGYKSMSEPTNALLELIGDGYFHHGGNPVLTWNADNFCVTRDPADNIKPAKDKARGRIDGVVAIINAIGAAQKEGVYVSKYTSQGVVTL